MRGVKMNDFRKKIYGYAQDGLITEIKKEITDEK